jgi:Flp pilus assembly protein TadG
MCALNSYRKDQGGALVEFALVLPLLLTIVFGIVEFSVVLYDKAVITNASREAARAGVIFRTPAFTDAQITAVATNACASHLISFGDTSPQVSLSRPSGSTAGNPLTVTVSYPFTGLMLGNLIGPLFGNHSITASTTMVYE